MRLDVRPTQRLRNASAVNVTAALEPVIGAVREDDIDLSRLRVVCDWVQYRNNFRPAQLVLEFARKGPDDLRLFQQYGWDGSVGAGVIDVKTKTMETPETVARRIRRALEFVPAERLSINPDCGLRNLSVETARAKLDAMVAGAAQARADLEAPSEGASQRISVSTYSAPIPTLS